MAIMENLKVRRKVQQAYDALEQAANSMCDIDSITQEFEYKCEPVLNTWRTVPVKIATRGVLTSSVSSKNNTKELLYMPRNGHIEPHKHSGIRQSVTVISGIVYYEVYEGDQHSNIIKCGELRPFETVTMDGENVHYIFTSKLEAYMLVEHSLL